MNFNKFSSIIAFRTILIMLTLVLLVNLYSITGYLVITMVVFLLVIAQSFLLFRFVSKTNAELTRFFDAARYADFSQRFDMGEFGAGFGNLGKIFTDILDKFQDNRLHQEEELRHLKAIIEHVPTPLISLHSNGTIKLWNNSARRLFGAIKVSCQDDLQQFGNEFFNQVGSLTVGERRLVNFNIDGMEQQLTISVTEIVVGGNRERLISLQDIKSELDTVQLQAWQDLVRVLTHEIMNSITPVSSLAKTAVDLIKDASIKLEQQQDIGYDLEDISDAVITVARRSDGLMNFVSSYRQLTRLPPPKKSRIKVTELFSQVTKIMTQQWQEVKFETRIEPIDLDLNIDRDMIEQILINLLKNAEQAISNTDKPRIKMVARLNKRGHVVIEISDNGPGISAEIANEIFVPFFTTKQEGSGVGLALTRQTMIAHGGTVKLEQSEWNGALFRLIF